MSGEWLAVKTVIRCGNFEKSRDFYARVLGLAVVEEWSEQEGRGAVFSLGGAAGIEIYEMSQADPRFDERFARPLENDKIDMQLECRSVAEWVRRLAGVWEFQGPDELPWGHRWIRLRDPDRLLIAIYEKQQPAPSGWLRQP